MTTITLTAEELDAIEDGHTVSRVVDDTYLPLSKRTLGGTDTQLRFTDTTIERLRSGEKPQWNNAVDGVHIEVELDRPTIAGRALEILREHDERAGFDASRSDHPDEQYVDVFPNPVDKAAMDWSLRSQTVDALRDAGIRIESMHCGCTRNRFNDYEYRIWFTTLK